MEFVFTDYYTGMDAVQAWMDTIFKRVVLAETISWKTGFLYAANTTTWQAGV